MHTDTQTQTHTHTHTHTHSNVLLTVHTQYRAAALHGGRSQDQR